MAEGEPVAPRPKSDVLRIINTELFFGIDPLSPRPGCRGGYLGRKALPRALTSYFEDSITDETTSNIDEINENGL